MVLKVFQSFSGWYLTYIEGSVLVASLVEKPRLSYKKQQDVEGIYISLRYMYFICLPNISVHQHIVSISVSACSFSMKFMTPFQTFKHNIKFGYS